MIKLNFHHQISHLEAPPSGQSSATPMLLNLMGEASLRINHNGIGPMALQKVSEYWWISREEEKSIACQ